MHSPPALAHGPLPLPLVPPDEVPVEDGMQHLLFTPPEQRPAREVPVHWLKSMQVPPAWVQRSSPLLPEVPEVPEVPEAPEVPELPVVEGTQQRMDEEPGQRPAREEPEQLR